MPLKVYSGIKAPEDTGGRPGNVQRMSDCEASSPFPAPTPVPLVSPMSAPPIAPLQSPHHTDPVTGPSDLPDEPPPSYEDAIAEDLAPSDGPRRNYGQNTPTREHTDGVDSKRNISP